MNNQQLQEHILAKVLVCPDIIQAKIIIDQLNETAFSPDIVDVFFQMKSLINSGVQPGLENVKRHGGILSAFLSGNLHTLNVEESCKRLCGEDLKAACQEILAKREPCGTFDTAILPPLLQKYVDSKCRETNSEPILIVSSIISMLSAMIGKRSLIPKTIHYQSQGLFPNIWTLVIAPSGGGKTTAQNKGMSIVYRYETEIQKRIKEKREEIINLTNEKITAKGQHKQDIDRKINEYQLEIEKIEGDSMILQSAGSLEGLLDSLRYSMGGVVNTSEFGAWIKGLGKDYNAGAKESLTELFDVPRFSPKTRTKSGGVIPSVELPFISINAVSTLTWVKKNIQSDSDVESGFFARFLLFYPPQARRRGAALPNFIEKDFTVENQIIEILDNFRRQYSENPLEYKIDNEARIIFKKSYDIIFDEIELLSETGRDILHPYINRWTAYIAKIAQLLQPFYEGGEILKSSAFRSAIGIIEYAIRSTVYLLQNELGETTIQESTRKVFEFIAKKGGNINFQQLAVSKTLSGGKYTKSLSEEYMNILDMLVDMGKITIDKSNRNKKKWQIAIITEG